MAEWLEARETARRHSRLALQAGPAERPGFDPSAMQPRRAYTEAPESKACLDQWRPTDNIILLNEVVLMVLFFFNISDKDNNISDKDIEWSSIDRIIISFNISDKDNNL